MEELLRPQHPGEGLAQHTSLVLGRRRRREPGVEAVRLGAPHGHDVVERVLLPVGGRAELEAHLGGLAGLDRESIASGRLGARPLGIDGVRAAHDVVVDAVLREVCSGQAEQTLCVRLVLAEEQLGIARELQQVATQLVVLRDDGACLGRQRGLASIGAPRPGVAEPQRRQDLDRRRFRSGVADRDLDVDVVWRRLRELCLDPPIAVVIEDASVDELELGILLRASSVLLDEAAVGELALRVVVPPSHVRMRGRGVDEPPVLLGVLGVVALFRVQPEDALFQNRIAPVPERERETQRLAVVAPAREAILVPPVRTRPRMVMGERVPRRAVGAVVLTHGSPGSFREVRTPSLPGHEALIGLIESATLRRRFGPRSSGRHRSCPFHSRPSRAMMT